MHAWFSRLRGDFEKFKLTSTKLRTSEAKRLLKSFSQKYAAISFQTNSNAFLKVCQKNFVKEKKLFSLRLISVENNCV